MLRMGKDAQMIIADWLIETTKKLGKAEVDAPRTDALVLLEDVLGKDRSWILAHDDQKIPTAKLKEVNSLTDRRIRHEPLAYIRGKTEFYGRNFIVSPEVLIPRPETESIVELALENIKLKKPKIVDIGCGSGNIGISLKSEKPDWQIDLVDIDKKALEIATQNNTQHKLELNIIESDLFGELKTSYDVVVANLPYVPEGLITSPEIEKEPSIALFSGVDGMSHYTKFWDQISKLSKKPKYIIIESLESQHMIMAGIAQKSGYTLLKTYTLAQLYSKV